MREFCKKEIDFTMIKLNNTVDAMVECMRENHQEIEVQNMSEEFVAAFVDQQPQDIKEIFNEADDSKYNMMQDAKSHGFSTGVTVKGSLFGASSAPSTGLFGGGAFGGGAADKPHAAGGAPSGGGLFGAAPKDDKVTGFSLFGGAPSSN